MGNIFMVIIQIVCIIKAVMMDIAEDRLGWTVTDIVLWPIGVIRGIAMFFGLI